MAKKRHKKDPNQLYDAAFVDAVVAAAMTTRESRLGGAAAGGTLADAAAGTACSRPLG